MLKYKFDDVTIRRISVKYIQIVNSLSVSALMYIYNTYIIIYMHVLISFIEFKAVRGKCIWNTINLLYG